MEGNGRLVSVLSPGCGANGSAALTVPRATFLIGHIPFIMGFAWAATNVNFHPFLKYPTLQIYFFCNTCVPQNDQSSPSASLLFMLLQAYFSQVLVEQQVREDAVLGSALCFQQ